MYLSHLIKNLIDQRKKIGLWLAAGGGLAFAVTLLAREAAAEVRAEIALAGLLLLLGGLLAFFARREIWVELGLFFMLTVPFFAWVTTKYIHLDFWGGEIDLLARHIFAPLSATLLPGGSPSNPALASLFGRLALQLQGVPSLAALLDEPAHIRYLGLGWSVLAMVAVYLAGRKFAGSTAGFLALMVLTTSIPFYNYAVQVRGYSLSILLASLFLFNWWSYEESQARVHAVMVAAGAALLLYNAPSNLYFIGGAAAYALLNGLSLYAGRPFKEMLTGPQMKLAGLSLAGTAAAGLVILLFGAAGQAGLSAATGMFNTATLTGTLPQVLDNFISTRFLMILLAAVGWFYSTRSVLRGDGTLPVGGTGPSLADRCGFLAVVLLAPFIISFVRGDVPGETSYLVLLPAFSLLVGLGLYAFYQRLPKRLQRAWIALAAVGLYLYGAFYAESNRMDAFLRSAPVRGQNLQTLYSNYYQSAYHPRELLQEFSGTTSQADIPLEVYQWGDQAAGQAYLQHFNLTYRALDNLEQLQLNPLGKAYVFTAFPDRFEQDAAQSLPGLQCEMVNVEAGYWNIYLCSCRESTGQGCRR